MLPHTASIPYMFLFILIRSVQVAVKNLFCLCLVFSMRKTERAIYRWCRESLLFLHVAPFKCYVLFSQGELGDQGPTGPKAEKGEKVRNI